MKAYIRHGRIEIEAETMDELSRIISFYEGADKRGQLYRMWTSHLSSGLGDDTRHWTVFSYEPVDK